MCTASGTVWPGLGGETKRGGKTVVEAVGGREEDGSRDEGEEDVEVFNGRKISVGALGCRLRTVFTLM